MSKFAFFGDAWLQFLAICKYPFYLCSNLGSVFNLHESQASQGFCVQLIKDYIEIYNLISGIITNSDNPEEDLKNTFKQNLLKNWNGMVETQCLKFGSQLTLEQKVEFINYYLNNIKSVDKLELFPFKSFFKNQKTENSLEECKAEILWLRNNWIPKSEIEILRNSKSWKLTAPLRAIENITRSIF
jgi:hypothetical protein